MQSKLMLVSNLSFLSPEAKEMIEEHAGTTDARKIRFKAIMNGRELISFVTFTPNKNSCFIDYIWRTKKIPKEYLTKSNISPAKYLVEELVRKGFRHFDYDLENFSEDMERMVKRLTREGFWFKNPKRYEEATMTSRAVKQAIMKKTLVKPFKVKVRRVRPKIVVPSKQEKPFQPKARIAFIK